MKNYCLDMNGSKKRLFQFLGALVILLCLFLPQKSNAAGLLIADGGFGGVLEIKSHEVKTTINNGIAVTTVTQVFKNTENRQVEALYTFPVPKGASVSNFSMWINGKEVVGEVLEKKRAREIYNSYKRKRRDPGLLEQVDYKTFEMRIYPINAQAEQKVQLTYYQELNIDHDQATYVYPLATATRQDIDSRTTGKFAIQVEIKSAIPLTEVVSPSHGNDFVTTKDSPTYCLASLETAAGSLAADVVINYDLARPKTGIDLITSKPKGEDGYFCMTLTTGKELETLDTGMDYLFLLDISGSMANDRKLIVSRNSVEAFIDELGSKDRIEIMTFNVAPNMLFRELKPALPSIKEEARQFTASRQAKGGTILAPAITTAYKYNDPDRTLNVIILSDGMTEQKERQQLMDLIRSRPRNTRVFCIGIGNEVNRPLLKQLADDSGGLAAFISQGDNFKRAARGFRRKLIRPVATDLQIDFDGIQIYDLEPKTLPNLYFGSPIRIYGRYAKSGKADLSIRANVLGRELKKTESLLFPEKETNNPEIERMWAWKRVEQLLKKTDRLNSRQATLNEIIRLGEGYSIVTEYTSFLVLENDAEYRKWNIDRKNNLRLKRDRQAQAERAKNLKAIRNKAMSDIGPQTVALRKITPPTYKPQPLAPAPATKTTPQTFSQRDQSRVSRGFDLDFGTGPVGPLFVGISFWLSRRKRKQ